MRNIILASQSPRRRELLSMTGLKFKVVPSDFDERLDDARTPEAVAKELGLGKALAVAKQFPDAIVIGSDAIVTIDGRQLGKPKDLAGGRQMLHDVTQHPNKITSSLAVVCLADKLQIVKSENAWVYFKPFDEQAVEAYLATGDYADKAGAYGVQSGAAPLIDHVQGNVDVVMGLPTHVLAPILQKLGHQAKPVDYPVSGVKVIQIA